MSKNSNSLSKAEVLWSRLDSFNNKAHNNSLENETSSSSSSFGFDDYEVKSIQRIKASLDAIDSALYEGTPNAILSQELFDECQKWSKRFVHLKLDGEQILRKSDESRPNSSRKNYSSSKINYNVKQVPTLRNTRNDNSSTKNEVCSSNIEDWDRCYSSSDRISDKDSMRQKSNEIPISIENIKDKVIVQLAARIWADVVLTYKGKKDSSTLDFKETSRLPPINNSCKIPTPTKNSRERNPLKDMPKLDGILTVSPKVLSNRSEARNFPNSRPNTGASIPPRLSARSALPQHSTLPCYTMDDSKNKNLDFIKLYLPVLEEDGIEQLSTSFKVEPLSKETVPMSAVPKQIQLSLKPTNFLLPPIDIKSYTSIYDNGEIPRPISYDSCATTNKGRKNVSLYARHMNSVNSSPSTAKLSSVNPKSPVFSPRRFVKQSSPLRTKGSGKQDKGAFPYKNCTSLISTSSKMPLPSNLVSMFPKATVSVAPSDIFKKKNSVNTRPNKTLGALQRKASR